MKVLQEVLADLKIGGWFIEEEHTSDTARDSAWYIPKTFE